MSNSPWKELEKEVMEQSDFFNEMLGNEVLFNIGSFAIEADSLFKNCPFCGGSSLSGEVSLVSHPSPLVSCEIICSHCMAGVVGVGGTQFEAARAAREAWNRRTNDDD